MASDSRPERTRDAARTKQRLLDAARDEFAEYGIAGARVERIAAAARCNKALIYAYFDSKDALFDAAFAAHVQAHLDRVNFDGTDLPPTPDAYSTSSKTTQPSSAWPPGTASSARTVPAWTL